MARPSATTRAADPPARPDRRQLVTQALLLHGQPGGAADWDGVLAALRGRTTAMAIDRPGWDGHTRAQDLAGNARAALAALDARGVERAVVVGHSLGAAIAAWLAVHHGERVSALVLVAPAANRAALGRLDRWLATPGLAELSGAAAMASLGVALSLDQVRGRVAAAVGLPDGYLRRARTTLLRPGAWRSYATEQRALVRGVTALEPDLQTIVAPTTILFGDRDAIVSPAAAQRLSEQIPGARLVARPGAGHLLPQRAPEFVAGQILAALSGAAGSTLAGA
jgi:pimeloyl-ACP methyl ester carboxylesterase